MMQSVSKTPDLLEAGTLRSRSTSLSSDSALPRVNLMSPPSVTPPPAFISPSAASEIITADQEFNAADFVAEDDDAGSGASALITTPALALLNGFLDNILFNILAASRSTQLTSIRPAVSDVLKPRLASEVVSVADEELSEYMGGAEDEQTEFRGGQEPGGEFDLVRAWKLTRLRCMVYTRLGDMEEDDEDEFIARDGLGESDGAPRRFSSHVDNITPAAAIFLTSIIEYIGERALVIAGETSRSRLSAKLNDDGDESVEMGMDRTSINQLVVEDLDMERLALNATLGRLWRMWKKRRRTTPMSRTLSRESFHRRGPTRTLANSRKSSIVTIEEPVTPSEPALDDASVVFDPASIPLPMTDYDVQEIEVPGFSPESEGEIQTMEAVVAHKVRPRSLMVFSTPSRSPTPTNGSPKSASAVEDAQSARHTRSRSLPTSGSNAPELVEAEPAAEQSSARSSEEQKRLTTMYEDDESAEFVDAAEPTPGIAITTPHESTESVADTMAKLRMSVVREEDEYEEEEEQAAPGDNEITSLQVSALEGDSTVDQQAASPMNTEDEESVIDQLSSGRASISSLSDRGTQDAEVIEGRGMCEKPKLTAIQRPKRASRDVTQLNAKPIPAESSDPDMHPVAEIDPPTQGVDTTPEPSVVTREAIESTYDKNAMDGNQIKAVTTSSSPQLGDSDDTAEEEKQVHEPTIVPEEPRPPSTASNRSQQSRTRHRPTPLVVVASNRSSSRRTDSGSSTATERAAVQRMPHRPTTAVVSPTQSRAGRSESLSSAREKRPVTASSTTSQVSTKLKGFMGRQPGDSPSLRLRSSSETSRASGSGDSLDEATELDLDRLINSDETLHYTLTPRSVREMTFPDIPRQMPRSEVADTADLYFLKNTAPAGEDASRSRTSVSSRATAEMNSASRTKSAESPRHLDPRVSMSTKAKVGQARDARPPAESTRDFAAFIKATGPTGTPTSAPFPQSPAREVMQSSRASSISTTSSRANRPRLEARPAETKGSQTSDLIDFIREGPPVPGAHRIPRTVAPFRNTIDSDDLQLDAAQMEKGPTTRSSLASTQGGSTPNKSLTSVGSRTGLLDSTTNRVNRQPSATASGSTSTQDDPRPARKQRRVPDPYAIDDDDDDELLEELMNLSKPQREEESLMDFLRDAPPPETEEHPQPFSVNLPPSSRSNGNAGAGGMTSRLLRSAADKVPTPKTSRTSMRAFATPNYPPAAQNQSNYSFKVGMERNGGSMPPNSKRQTDTSALADFLRNTGPTQPPPSARPAPSAAGGQGALSRFFVRRKKVEV